MASIAIYSIFTAACGFATGVVMLAVFRIFLGLGMGGEWASGASLVSETWPAEHRGKALGIVQSSWAVGYAAAAAVAALVLPLWGWRGVFFVGVLPAFFTLWIQKKVREPELWKKARAASAGVKAGFAEIFGRKRIRITVFVTVMNACTMFGWWGFNLWLPAYLSMPASEGGIGGPGPCPGLVIFMQVGMWLGYVLALRRRPAEEEVLCGIVRVAAAGRSCFSVSRQPLILFALGPFVAFFGWAISRLRPGSTSAWVRARPDHLQRRPHRQAPPPSRNGFCRRDTGARW